MSLSGVVPQISVILGPCAGGAAYSPALTDFVFGVKDKTNRLITGPDAVEAVTGEATTREELGGAMTHATRTGVATFLVDDESSCFDEVRYLLSFLPSNNQEDPPYFVPTDQPSRRCDELLEIAPAEPNRAYDVRDVIEVIVDDGDYLEVQPLWAKNIVCAYARLDGHVVGIVANQPLVLAGALNIDAAEKAARFVRTCDSFNIPRVHLWMSRISPGVDQEHAGIIRRGAKLLYAFCEDRPRRPGGPAQVDGGGAGHRHGLEVSWGRLVVRLAVQRDSCDGRRGRGQHHLPQGTGRSTGPDETSKGAGVGVHRTVDDAIYRRGTRDGRRRDRPR